MLVARRFALFPTLSLLLSMAAAGAEPAVTISGTVADVDGKPVAGATVIVAEGPTALSWTAQSSPAAAPKAPDVLATATSDAAGKFSAAMPHEAPEATTRRTRLTVWVHHSDFSLAVRLIDRDWPRAGLPLTIRLPATDSVRFKITDANYRPATGARVTPLRFAGHLVPEAIRARLVAVTDERGRVTLAGVVSADLETVQVENEVIGVQWAGLPAQGRDRIILLDLVPVGSLTGQLTVDDPHAVARRKLCFATWQIPGDEYSGGGLAEVVTDDEGKFDVPAIAAGSLTFDVREDEPAGPSPKTSAAGKGHAPERSVGTAHHEFPAGDVRPTQARESAPFRGAKGDDEPVYLAAQLTGPPIEAGKTTTFDVPLRRAVRVIQEVRDEETDAPIAGVRVSVSFDWQHGVSADTDESGRVSLDVLPGRRSPKLVRVPSDYYDPTGGLRSGVEVADKPEAVTVGALKLARGARLTGQVVDANHNPLAGAEVSGCWKLRRTVPIHAWSDANGEFTIHSVAPQTPVWLWARHGDKISVKPTSAQPGGQPATVMVGKESGASLEGRVVNAAGQPIAGAVVRVAAIQPGLPAGTPSTDLGYMLFDSNDRLLTDAQGRFQTPRSLRPKVSYSIDVTAPGRLPYHGESIEPESGRTTRFADAVLHAAPRLRTMSGRVLDREGRAVTEAIVWQSGDGPRRTETTSDAEGRFTLGGLYDTPALLFVRKDGYRPRGARVAPDDKTCDVILQRHDAPPVILRTLPPALSMAEERELAMALIKPSLPMLRDQVLSIVHHELLRTLARVDPASALEAADTLPDQLRATITRTTAARSLVSLDFDAGLAAISRLDRPDLRVQECVFAFYELFDAPAERRARLLDEALVHARAETHPALKASELGRIGVCWLDLDQRERGAAVLREGQTLAESLPEPNETNPPLSFYRGAFAGWLAHIDTAAALRLLEGFRGSEIDRYRTHLAYGLADHDPAEAERTFRLIQQETGYFWLHLAPLARMSTADAPRAARLARTLIDPCERGFALGTVAHGLAASDRAAATELLESAFGVLEGAPELGPTQYGRRDAALTAAALLPVAENIAPALVEGYFWRALSLRGPRPAPGDLARTRDTRLAQLAGMIARYDRGIARDLLAPLAARLRETLAEGARVEGGLAMTDPRWAAELVWALPDVPASPGKSLKLRAARRLAGSLARPRRGAEGAWDQLYRRCYLRDPDTVYDVW